MGKTHAASGLVASMAVCSLFELGPAAPVVAAAVFYVSALGPDIDHPSAPAARFLGPVSWVVCRAVRRVSVWATGVAHRGLAHSFLAAGVYGLLTGWLSAQWLTLAAAVLVGLFAAAGYAVGFLGDVPTRTSLKHVWWPLEARFAFPRWLRFTTGKGAERVVFHALCVAGVFLLPAVVR